MSRPLFCLKIAVLASLLALGLRIAWADEFELALEVKGAERKARTEETATAPSTAKPRPRPALKAKAGELLKVQWRASNLAGEAVFPDVLVHFFVVRQEKTGQQEVPKLDESVSHEGALTMDFKPKEKAQGKFTLRLEERGSYLVRVETVGMAEEHGHEHFAALDVVIE